MDLIKNPLVQKAVASGVRWLLTISIGAWLAKSGALSDAEIVELVGALALALTPLVWGIWEKYRSQQKQNTTLAVLNGLTGPTAENVTASDIDAVIKAGDKAPATTPPTAVPVLKGTGDGMARLREFVGGTGN